MADFEVKPVERLMPPYSNYNRMRRFVQEYEKADMPDDVTAVLEGFGSTAKHHLRSSLRAVRFIDEHNRATQLFKQYARTSGQERNALFRQVLIRTYPYLLGPEATARGFDAIRASRQELIKKFQEAGVEAKSTQERCADFFRGAIRDAGWVQDSSLLNKPRSNSAPSLGGDSLQVAFDEMSGAVRSIVPEHDAPLSLSSRQSGPPPLPPYEEDWSPETKRMWMEMRYIEVKKMGP